MALRLSIENHVPRLAYGDEKAIEMIAQAGFDAIDFSFYWMPEGQNILDGDDYLSYAAKVRACADRHDIAISQTHAPFDFTLADDKENQAYHHEQIRRSIEFSGVLGAKCIVIHNLPTSDLSDFFETNLVFFKSFEETARKSGVKIAVENLVAREENRPMPGRLGTPEELSAMLDQLDPEVYCACIDLGHAQLVTKDPAAFIRRIGTPRLQSIHVQDTIYHLDAHTLPYLGRQNWYDITSALAEVNYTGDFTLEVFLFLNTFPKEALADALKLAHTVGRGLIEKVDAAKAKLEAQYAFLNALREQFSDRYDLTLTTSMAVDDGFTINVPLLTGTAHDRIFWLYDDGDMLVFDVMNTEQTAGTHFHPDEEDAAEEIILFMEGRIDYKLSPYPQA